MTSNTKPARRERREFSEACKAEAVRMVAECRAAGATLTQVDVRPDQLRDWARLPRDASSVVGAVLGETVEQENRRLRREVATLRQEQAFIKNVAAYFAKETR